MDVKGWIWFLFGKAEIRVHLMSGFRAKNVTKQASEILQAMGIIRQSKASTKVKINYYEPSSNN